MTIMKTKSLFVALAIAGLPLMAIAEEDVQDQTEILDSASQSNTWHAQIYYWRGQQLYHGMGCDRDLPAAAGSIRNLWRIRTMKKIAVIMLLVALLAAAVPAVAPVIPLTKAEVENAHSYKVDKDFERVVPDKPRRAPARKPKEDGEVDEDMDAGEFRKTPKKKGRWILPLILILLIALFAFILARVFSPTLPSAVRPFAFWNSFTAVSVAGPKSPSAEPL